MGQDRIHLDSRGDSGRCASVPSTCPVPRRILLPLHTYIGSKSDGSGNSAPEAVTTHADTVESAAAKGLASLKAPQAPSLSWAPSALVSDARRSNCAQASSTLPYVACRIGFLAIKTQSIRVQSGHTHTHRFPHTTLHKVSHDRTSDSPAHRETETAVRKPVSQDTQHR